VIYEGYSNSSYDFNVFCICMDGLWRDLAGVTMWNKSKALPMIAFIALFIIAIQLSGFCFLDQSVDWLSI
jgi:hypothetical protein